MDDDPFDDLEDEALLKAAAQEESSLTEAQVHQRLCNRVQTTAKCKREATVSK